MKRERNVYDLLGVLGIAAVVVVGIASALLGFFGH
jgi:hypothetical protein